MVERRGERLKRTGTRIGLYLLTGLLAFTLIRLVFAEYGITGPSVALVALLATLVILELLTRVGWLTKPFAEDRGDHD